MKPLAIDLFCGLGGWSDGLLAEGWRVVGFDIEQHDYGTGGYPGQLVIQDVLTLHGSQFRNASLIVASPPCQAYSYRAMPWSRAKALPPPDNTLFDACFQIQAQANYANGVDCPDCFGSGKQGHTKDCSRCNGQGWVLTKYIPLIVENVRGAIKWVSQPVRWHWGSFYLWGDVPALMPPILAQRMKSKISCAPRRFDERVASTPEEAHALHYRMPDGAKTVGHANIRDGHTHARHLTNQRESELVIGQIDEASGRKQGGDWFGKECSTSMSRLYGSKSNSRKAASAMIAKIPEPLARHIARVFKPKEALDVG
jgi:hypothetical protein